MSRFLNGGNKSSQEISKYTDKIKLRKVTKIMKKTLALFLSVIMVLATLVPMSVFAQEPTSGFRVTKADNSTVDTTTIEAAVSALEAGSTLKMYENATITSALVITENNITIDGNGKKITVTSTADSVRTFNLEGSTQDSTFNKNNRQKVTMKNLDIDFNSSGPNTWAMTVRADVDLTLDTVKISTAVAAGYGFYQNQPSVVTMKNCEIIVGNDKIAYSVDNAAATLNMENCKLTSPIEGGYITSGGGNATVQFHKEGAVCNVYGGYIYNTGTHRAISADSALAVTLNIYGGTFVVMATNACVNISDTSYSVYGGTFINLSNNTASRYTAAGKANLDNAVSVIHMAFNPPTSEAYVTTANNKLTVSVGGEEKNIYYNISGGRPEMEIGAAVRLLGETAPDSDTFGNGIRFTSHFSSELINSLNAVKDEGTELSYGTLIVPTDYLDTLGLYTISKDVLTANGYTFVDIKASNGLVADADGGITIRAALTDLKTENLGRDFSAVAYVSYVKDGKTVYAYAAYNETNNSRSMSGVAQAALDDLKDSEQSYYKFAVEVEGVTKYSPYNDEQRATLKKYIPAAN